LQYILVNPDVLLMLINGRVGLTEAAKLFQSEPAAFRNHESVNLERPHTHLLQYETKGARFETTLRVCRMASGLTFSDAVFLYRRPESGVLRYLA